VDLADKNQKPIHEHIFCRENLIVDYSLKMFLKKDAKAEARNKPE
jgi:hypothetical protein